jgi:acetyl-CoA carboxylase carboxyltransferase component
MPPEGGRHVQQELVKKQLRSALQTVQAMLMAGEMNPLDAVADLSIVRDRLATALEALEQAV